MAGPQPWVAKSPVFLVFCADLDPADGGLHQPGHPAPHKGLSGEKRVFDTIGYRDTSAFIRLSDCFIHEQLSQGGLTL